jgi:hypothetical protein
MSTHAGAISAPGAGAAASSGPSSIPALASRALGVGVVGIGLTALGLLVSGASKVAFSWLIAVTFWTGLALGMLMLVMIHHIFDASWSTVIRRQFEHGLASFQWLLVLFLPLIIGSYLEPSLVWKWMDPFYNLAAIGSNGAVGEDVLWIKKAGLLNPTFFTLSTIGSFLIWIWLAKRLRRASFNQDRDGDLKWTRSNRVTAAFGLPLGALTLSLCIILWSKSLDYHWFSTMYGVWYFAGAVRVALSAGVIIMVWLWWRGDYRGILNNNHWYSIGVLMFAFTVFWAYVTFSQYFLIWNANIPEETFWYNIREMNNSDGLPNQWKWVGMLLLFGHFFVPFLLLLSYKRKLDKTQMPWIAAWIAFVVLMDIIYNIFPSKRVTEEMVAAGQSFGLAAGDPLPFLAVHQLWTLTAVIGVGGICVWAYLKSFPTAKLIPIRDPRIGESLTHHE